MASISSVLPIVRGELSKLKIPTTHDKVYNDECVQSFDSPYSDNGLYVNILTYLAYGSDYYRADSIKNKCKLYIHEKWIQVPITDSTTTATSTANATAMIDESTEIQTNQPSKLAIGTDGGFTIEPKYEIQKTNQLVVITDSGPLYFPLPCTELPEYLSNVITGIVEHNGMKRLMTVDAWDAANDLMISKYAVDLIQLPCTHTVSQDASTWKCEMSGIEQKAVLSCCCLNAVLMLLSV